VPFAEFRDPFAVVSSIPPGLGLWTAEAIAPYFYPYYDVVGTGELYWWMGRLGLTFRDVLTDPYSRLALGRALGARYFLMGSLHEVASFDVSTHVIDAELNVQTHGADARAECTELLPIATLANITMLRRRNKLSLFSSKWWYSEGRRRAARFRKGTRISLGCSGKCSLWSHHIEAWRC
jgi:hypothetical protein